MIFQPKMARLVKEGRKTQTRRPVKPGELKPRYTPGKTYAVQRGRGKPGTARIEILAAAKQRLGDVTFEDVRAEGFRTTDDFFADWRELHGDVDLEQEVWVYVFVLVEERRFLARRMGQGEMSGDVRDYVHEPAQGVSDEGEALTEGEHRKHVQRPADERWSDEVAKRKGRREEDDLETRLGAVRSRARMEKVDISKDERVIKKRVEALERRLIDRRAA